MKLHHVAIQVTDLDVAEAFYAGALGLVITRRQPHAIWLDADGVVIMLERAGAVGDVGDVGDVDDEWASPCPGPFVVALAIDADTRLAWKARLADSGIALHHESAFTLYFRDPFGTRLALSHFPEAAPA